MGENVSALVLFIPLVINIPFLTERYQDIFIPYASGIRSAFFGTIWVMTIAMLVSMPVSIGAAIYLEEYAKPTRTTKLIRRWSPTSPVFRPLSSACLAWPSCEARRHWFGTGPLHSGRRTHHGCDGHAIIVLASKRFAGAFHGRCANRPTAWVARSGRSPETTCFLQPCPAS